MSLCTSMNSFINIYKVIFSINNRCNNYLNRSFKEHYGVSATICSITWNMLVSESSIPQNGSPKHILWCLMFLKTYSTTGCLAKTFCVDEKTVRKWIWLFIEAISTIQDDIVSNFIIYLCIFMILSLIQLYFYFYII